MQKLEVVFTKTLLCAQTRSCFYENTVVCTSGLIVCKRHTPLFVILAGFSGPNCQLNGNIGQSCINNQCRNGASCYETSSTTYGCACPGGFYGTFCELTYTGPINQNSCTNSPCLNGGTCQALGASSFVCLCPSKLNNLSKIVHILLKAVVKSNYDYKRK